MLYIAAEAAGHTKGPTGYEISERYLRDELHDIQEYVQFFKPFWRESGCTIMADGWTGPTSRPLINFLIYSTKGTVFHRSVDTSGHVKDADYLFRLFDQVVDEVGEENVVQFVTDNEPSYKAAGSKLMEKREHLFWSPCAAHCIDLILERIGKKKNIQKIVANARMITTFIYNYSQLVALMRKYTDNHELLRPGITRFTTNFIALESLYRHRGALGEMFASRDWRESRIASSSRHTGAVVEVPKLILDNSFWSKVKGVMSIMEPLIKVLKLVDGDEKPIMGFLYEVMMRARAEIEAASTHPQQYLEIIDERWARQLHHDLHAAGFFLNPRFQYQEGFEYNDNIRSGVTKVIERLTPNVTFAIEATRERVNKCLEDACVDSQMKECAMYMDCGEGNRIANFKNMTSWPLWTNNTNATGCFDTSGATFNYGIYESAVPITTESSIITRYIYSLFWGFQQISTLAGNQTPSSFIWEILFTMGIIGLGLLLFALLIGNMQNFLQALGRRRLEMQLRRRDVEQWMSHRRLPAGVRRRVRQSERFNWAATRGVNEEELLENLPEDLQREIRRHLFKFIKKVRIFTLMEEPILDAICESLRQTLYIEGSRILTKGAPIDKMVFIVRGKLENNGADGNVAPLSEGDVCGEELLTWCLDHNRDGRKINLAGQRLISNRTVKCLSNVEAFSLRAADLEEVTYYFARFLRNPRVQGAIRYESPYWRAKAAVCIQVTWRYRKKRLNRTQTERNT